MNAVAKPPLVDDPAALQLRVSRYDRAAALLVSLLILSSLAVTLMFAIWMTMRMDFRQDAVQIDWLDQTASQRQQTLGLELDMEAPGQEEMPELTEPQFAVGLAALTDSVSAVTASFDGLLTSKGKGKGHIDGSRDDRPIGLVDDDLDAIPRWERWEIRWTSTSLAAYARQLDYFKIELGAVGGSPQVDYASNLTKARPDTKQGSGKQEKRMYMTWKDGSLKKFDQALLAKAGVRTTNRLMLQFIPAQVEDSLAWVEREHAVSKGHTDFREYRKTVFGVRPKGRGYELYVMEQMFRPVPRK